ncbi:RNA polymerase sigma factor [Chitinophaga arvensicola]|uniref:RNA polymerase sigma factor n=1 Tax=Chitinophaga arvensicola TaxID=29529 RepID=UPI0015A68A00|nr:sigma-70 family RNA polymerase sigma factor [Chitinophaga arvensicola]
MNIISAIKAGNEGSYEQAYVSSRDKVFHYFLKKTRSEEDARDLLQTTFLKLWQYRHSLNEAYSLDQHLFNIAYTVFVDALRKEQKAQRIGDMLSREAAETTPADHRELDDRLHNLLEQLPPERKKAFILHRLEGYSYKEVASQLSISVKAVDNHISRALKHLKKYFIFFSLLLLHSLRL